MGMTTSNCDALKSSKAKGAIGAAIKTLAGSSSSSTVDMTVACMSDASATVSYAMSIPTGSAVTDAAVISKLQNRTSADCTTAIKAELSKVSITDAALTVQSNSASSAAGMSSAPASHPMWGPAMFLLMGTCLHWSL